MTKCQNPICKSTSFYMNAPNNFWSCNLCGMKQQRYNCGFYKCLKEFNTEAELEDHMVKVHPIT